MDSEVIHYEVFVRKNPTSRWVLELATDKPHVALATAEDLVVSARVAAAMVTKETFDPKGRVFHSETLFKEAVAGATRKTSLGDWDPLCAAPADLYADRGRARIAQLIEGWLARKKVTVFELMHSAPLVDQLEAASTELQHAVQKFAVAEVQIRGGVTHEMIRRIQALLDTATARLQRDHRRGAFPKVFASDFAQIAESLAGQEDAGYLLAGGVAGYLADADDWAPKVTRLLNLLEAAPLEGAARKLALGVLDRPLAEIVVGGRSLNALVGGEDDLGRSLATLTRLLSSEAVDRAAELDPSVVRSIPPLSGDVARLGERMAAGELQAVVAAAAKQVLAELGSRRRLAPTDPIAEVAMLRSLTLALLAAPAGLLPEEDLMGALAARSRSLLNSDFLDAYLGEGRSPADEAQALLWLAENMVGQSNKRRAARLVQACVSSLKFETDALSAAEPPLARLSVLANLSRGVARAGLVAEDTQLLQARLGQLGGKIEAKSGLVAALLKAQAGPVQKLTLLLRLASGEAAPLGPAAERARAEALKLVRDDTLRGELARDEQQMTALRTLIRNAGLAA